MEGSTHYRWDLPASAEGATWVSSYQAQYAVFILDNGDWYRFNIPPAPTFGASSLTLIEKSTDFGATWTTEKSIYTHNIGSEATYEAACRCGNESPVLVDDYVADAAINFELNFWFYGERGTDCILGLTNRRVSYADTDENWLRGSGYGASVWDSSTGRGDFTNVIPVEVSSASITDAFLASASSASKSWRYVQVGTYTGFNCVSDPDPNCGCLCPGGFPGAQLRPDSMGFTVGGSIGKAVTIDGDFAASNGYCSLETMGALTGLSEFSSGAALTTISNYVSTSEPEWSGVGVEREWTGCDDGYYDDTGVLPTPGAVCKANGYTRATPETNIKDGWWAEYQASTTTGFPTYGPLGGSGGTTVTGSGGTPTPQFSWTANGGGTDLTALSASIDATHKAAVYDPNTVRDKRAALEMTVFDETDCDVTFELKVTDYQLVHGKTSEITAGSPIWNAPVTTSYAGGRVKYDINVNNHWRTPVIQGCSPGRMLTDIVPTALFPHAYDSQTNVYGWAISNGSGGGAIVEAETHRWPNLSTNHSYVVETGTELDPEWTPWVVTFRKTVTKTSLAAANPTISFASADIVSSNFDATRSTFRPFANSNGYSIAQQFNSLGLFTPSGTNVHSILLVYKPADYVSPTIAVAESDWSASITLKQNPFYV